MASHLVIATRGSALALWQANHVRDSLLEIDPTLKISLNVIKTKGDLFTSAPLAEAGGKGLFVKEIEEALLDGRADLAVHSMKDVPMSLPDGLIIGCMPSRESCTDCFLSVKYKSIEDLPPEAHVGTSSLRRRAQLLALRPDLLVSPLRGNIDTRLEKLNSGIYDAIILATAGLFRLDLHAPYMVPLDTDAFLPAAGQGALGIECSEDNYQLLVFLAELEDRPTRVCVDAERSFLRGLNAGCHAPVAAYARMTDEENIYAQALVASPDGRVIYRAERSGNAIDAENLGNEMALELLATGAREVLDQPNLFSAR